jgi:hypothetical protein
VQANLSPSRSLGPSPEPCAWSHAITASALARRDKLKANLAKQAQEAAFVGYSSNADGAKAHTLHAVEGKQGKLKLVAQFKAPTAVKLKASTALQVQRQIEEVAREQTTLETTAVAMAHTGASNVPGAKDAGDAAAAEETDVAPETEGRQDGNEEAADQGEKSEGEEEGKDEEEEPGGEDEEEGKDEEEEPGGEDGEEGKGEEDDGEDEEDEEDDTLEGKELRAKSKQAKLKEIIQVKREAAGQSEGEPDSEEDNRKQEVQEEKQKEGEEESAAEETKKDSPSQSSSSDEASDGEDNEVTPRHPRRRNMLEKRAEHTRLWGSESGDDRANVNAGSETKLGEDLQAELTEAEQEKITYLKQIFCTEELMIVSDHQPPRAVNAAEPAWLLLLRKVAVVDCSDSFADQLIAELCNHQLVHCSLTGLKAQLTDQTVQHLLALLNDGCMSLVTAIY